MNSEKIQLADIYAAQRKIADLIKHTPLIVSESLRQFKDSEIYYKPEFLQNTGSFKIRGAANFALSLKDENLSRGLVTYSTGNHGRAVSYVARELGTEARVCLSNNVPENKKKGIKRAGGNLVVHGCSQDEAQIMAEEISEQEGRALVPPFDHPDIIAGQGTIGLEIIKELPELDSIIVPVSGGGLIGGIALAVKSINPECKVYGVSMEKGAAMYESLQAGEPVQVEEAATYADSLQGGILLDNKYTYSLVKKYVDEIVLVTEEEIGKSMTEMLYKDHLVIEGAAAVGHAALRAGKISLSQSQTVLIASGKNLENQELYEAAERKYN